MGVVNDSYFPFIAVMERGSGKTSIALVSLLLLMRDH